MNDSSLPEDLSRWPKDPYQLLGVDHAIDPRELRRVYTRLIRTFKPEQFPDHFRRIREAYEAVLRQAEFMQSFRNSREVKEEDAEPSTEEQAAAPREWKPTAVPEEDLDQLWQRACAGEEAAVYRRLVELHTASPGQVGLILRLYWLLVLTPGLDALRTPISWLAQGLKASALGGPLWELYRREIAADPAEALSDLCRALLRLPASPARLAELAEWRWQAARKLGRWEIIDDDLELLHGRLATDEPETWLGLLITASEQLAVLPGDGSRNLVAEVHKQIDRLDEVRTRQADSLDRLEFYRDVAAALRKLPPWPHSPKFLKPLISLSWTRPLVEIRPLLLQYLEYTASNPRAALMELDTVQGQAAPVLGQLSNILALFRGSLSHERSESRSREVLAGVVREFLDEQDWSDYDSFRRTLLEFCLREAIAPDAMAAVMEDGTLGSQLNKDIAMRCVVSACELFWM